MVGSDDNRNKIRVLVVEDEPLIQALIVSEFLKGDCLTCSTIDGSEAIALTREFLPDVIVLDLMLPGMSGEEILTALKKDSVLRSIPVIVFSNRSSNEDYRKLIDMGAEAYLVKADTDIHVLVSETKRIATEKMQ